METRFNLIHSKELSLQQKERLLQLWNNVYPHKLTYPNLTAFEEYLCKLLEPDFYILENHHELQAIGFTFLRDQEKWFALLVKETLQGKGVGCYILNKMKSACNNLSGWVLDKDDIKLTGEIYKSPLGFYLKNDFVLQNTRLENEKISATKIFWSK